MSMQTAANRFMVPPLQSRLYQQLFTSAVRLKELGNRLIRYAHHAQAFRKMEEVHQAAEILCNLPIKDYQAIGQYYLAWCERRTNPHAIEIFEKTAETAPVRFRSLAMHSLAALAARKQDYETELYWFVESLKVHTSAEALRNIAVIKAKEGYHSAAIKDLENMLPLARYSGPLIYWDSMNSLAVEYGEAGRKYEARNIIKPVLTSPYAPAYPEWQETAQELKEPNRSFISIPGSLPQVERKHTEIETRPVPTKKERNTADVLPFKKLKEAPEPDKPERVSHIDLDDMTDSEKLDFIMTALRTGAIRPSHYNDIIYQAGMLKAGPASKVIDLEDETVMTDKLIEWAHMIDPEDLAGVISALRDCDDKLRQVNLMDAMIRKLFEYSAACGVSEEAWRKKVERRLPKQ